MVDQLQLYSYRLYCRLNHAWFSRNSKMTMVFSKNSTTTATTDAANAALCDYFCPPLALVNQADLASPSLYLHISRWNCGHRFSNPRTSTFPSNSMPCPCSTISATEYSNSSTFLMANHRSLFQSHRDVKFRSSVSMNTVSSNSGIWRRNYFLRLATRSLRILAW